MNLPEFSVKHSILGNMLFLVVLVGGLFAAISMQREVFPEVSLDMVKAVFVALMAVVLTVGYQVFRLWARRADGGD